MKFNIPSHTIAVLETLANVVDIRVDRSLTDSYLVPRDYTPSSTLVELSFPPPPIRNGKVSEHDLYEWLPLVARALEKEEARIARVPSIAVLYEQEDCQESLRDNYTLGTVRQAKSHLPATWQARRTQSRRGWDRPDRGVE